MSISKKLNIRLLNEGEGFNPQFGGIFSEENKEKRYYLSHPQAATLWVMKDIPTAERQFSFYYFVCLMEIVRSVESGAIIRSEVLREKLYSMREDFKAELGEHLPWNGNAHFLIPHSNMLFTKDFIKGDTIDFEPLEKDFNKLTEYEFILYP